jgi:hypothetical protein
MNTIPDVYCPPLGLPLNWRDETSGELPAAIDCYYGFRIGEQAEPTHAQITVMIDYIRHHINAPCWAVSGEVERLREQAATLQTVEDINRYIRQAREIALDPF